MPIQSGEKIGQLTEATGARPEPPYTPLFSDGLLEFLSSRQHDIWASWVNHHLENSIQDDGTIVIPAEKVEAWRHLATTPYLDLSDAEQEKDRAVVREYLSEALYVEPTCFVSVCYDFDGVLSDYKSGWVEADIIPDEPVPGAIESLYHCLENGLKVAIHSARSGQHGGIGAMRKWLSKHDTQYRSDILNATGLPPEDLCAPLIQRVEFPIYKPAAWAYIDDRGIRFNGPPFPTADDIRAANTVWYRTDTE